MKKSQFMLVVSVFLALMITSHVLATSYDFRKATWGMSREKVLKSEKGSPTTDKANAAGFRFLAYPVTMVVDNVSHDMLAIYFFVEDQLFFARYSILTEHSNKNDF